MKHRVVGGELDQAALKYQRQHPEMSYEQALEAAMLDNPDLAKNYVQEFSHLSKRTAKQFGLEDAGNEDAGTIAAEKEIDRLVQAWLSEHPTEKDDYKKALEIVLARFPDLRMQWLKKYEGNDMRTGKPWSPPGYAAFDDGEDGDKRASAAADALVKKIKGANPEWTEEQCIQEARRRLKKKVSQEAERGVRIAELSEEIQIARDRARTLLAT